MAIDKKELDALIARRMSAIDWLMNKGPSQKDEKALLDLQKSIQMIARILHCSQEPVITNNLWNFLEDEVYERLEEFTDQHGVSLHNIPEDDYDCNPWTPSAYYEGKTDSKW